jgi:hypothetical protein
LFYKGGDKCTFRAPDQEVQTSDDDITNYLSEHIQSDIGSSLYKILTTPQQWTSFSNDGSVVNEAGARQIHLNWTDQTDHEGMSIWFSVEGFHNNIHGKCGNGRLPHGSGHMGNTQVAAFDPIFWSVEPLNLLIFLTGYHANKWM